MKILWIHFQIHYFGPFWSVKYLNFSKSYRFGQLIELFQKVETSWGYQKSMLCFFTGWSKIPSFLGSSSWAICEVEENFIQSFSPFFYFFLTKKISCQIFKEKGPGRLYMITIFRWELLGKMGVWFFREVGGAVFTWK